MSVKSDPLVPAPLKLEKTAGMVAVPKYSVCSFPGLPDGIWLLPLPSAVRREKLLLKYEPLVHL